MTEPEFADLVEAVKSAPSRRELLTDLLREDHEVYDQRGTAATVRMRGWLLAAFEHVGLPDSALPFVLEELETGRDAYLVAAGARALRACASPASEFAPFLMRAFANIRYHDEFVCFERYGQYALAGTGTTPLREVLQTLTWLGPHARGVLPQLEALTVERDGLSKTALDHVARAIAVIGTPAVVEPIKDGCCSRVAGLRAGFLWPRPSRYSPDRIQSTVLEDQEGSTVTFGEFFRGRPSVVVFFYTRCDNPQKCSLTISKLARLQQLLVERGMSDRVQTAAITYDPAFDLPPRLYAYGKSRGLRMDSHHRVMRATEGLGPLRAHFGLGVNFIESLVNRHRLELYVLDAAGRIAASFERFQWDERLVIERVVRLLEEESPVASPSASTSSGRTSRSRSGSGARVTLGAIAPLGVAFFPKCPVCWAAYLSVFGIAGLDRLPYTPWLLPVFVGLMLVNLNSLWSRGRATGRLGGFYLACAGALAILVLQMGFGFDDLAPCGVVLTLVGSMVSVLGHDNERGFLSPV